MSRQSNEPEKPKVYTVMKIDDGDFHFETSYRREGDKTIFSLSLEGDLDQVAFATEEIMKELNTIIDKSDK